jgi:hypothetical protein
MLIFEATSVTQLGSPCTYQLDWLVLIRHLVYPCHEFGSGAAANWLSFGLSVCQKPSVSTVKGIQTDLGEYQTNIIEFGVPGKRAKDLNFVSGFSLTYKCHMNFSRHGRHCRVHWHRKRKEKTHIPLVTS